MAKELVGAMETARDCDRGCPHCRKILAERLRAYAAGRASVPEGRVVELAREAARAVALAGCFNSWNGSQAESKVADIIAAAIHKALAGR